MKNIFFFLTLALLVSMTACDKVSDVVSSSMNAKIDGTSWSSTLTSGIEVSSTNTITLTGTQNNLTGDKIIITVPTTVTEGDHSLGSLSSYKAQYIPVGGVAQTYDATSGTVKITSFDAGTKVIKGTFLFTGINASSQSVDVSNGTFTVYYQ